MTQNESGDVWSALLALHADPPVLHKGETATVPTKAGGQYQYKYLDFADAWPVITEKLQKWGLVVIQPPSEDGLTTIVRHVPSGTEVNGWLRFPEGLDAQSTGSAMTYFRRYSMLSTLGLVADSDDDGAQATSYKARSGGEPSEKQRKFVGDLRREVKDLLGEADGGLAIRAAFESTGAIEGLTRDNVGPLIEMLIEVRDEAKKNKKERDLSDPQDRITVELPPDEEPLGVAYDPGDDIPF